MEDPAPSEFRRIRFVFKENGFCLAECQLIQQRDKLCQTLFLKCAPQTLHIGTIGNCSHSTCKTAVDVGLDGVGDDHIRLFGFQKCAIALKQLKVRTGIDATPVDRCFDAANAQCLKIVLVADKRHAQNDLVRLH